MSRSVKFFAFILVLMALASISLVACVRPGTVAAGSGSNSSSSVASTADVHMSDTNFVQSTVTIAKGGSVNMIDDTATPHIIQNGTWNNGTAKPSKENGAPGVQQQFVGNDTHKIGPFTTAGTFQLYCTIHPNMNLTVTVQ
ncbi:MAG TPA: plastocyanin/azurin family copper-binding protein [Ktedonobacteraceae bacterium]|nr:plastocyanin/azurin family copper-binding protein [Ktedonobacteraceae bacterium]